MTDEACRTMHVTPLTYIVVVNTPEECTRTVQPKRCRSTLPPTSLSSALQRSAHERCTNNDAGQPFQLHPCRRCTPEHSHDTLTYHPQHLHRKKQRIPAELLTTTQQQPTQYHRNNTAEQQSSTQQNGETKQQPPTKAARKSNGSRLTSRRLRRLDVGPVGPCPGSDRLTVGRPSSRSRSDAPYPPGRPAAPGSGRIPARPGSAHARESTAEPRGGRLPRSAAAPRRRTQRPGHRTDVPRPQRSPARRLDGFRTIFAPRGRPSRPDGKPHSVRPTPTTSRRQSFFRGPPGPARSSHGPPHVDPTANQRGRPDVQPTKQDGSAVKPTERPGDTARAPAPPRAVTKVLMNRRSALRHWPAPADCRQCKPGVDRPPGRRTFFCATGPFRDKPTSRTWSNPPPRPPGNRTRGAPRRASLRSALPGTDQRNRPNSSSLSRLRRLRAAQGAATPPLVPPTLPEPNPGPPASHTGPPERLTGPPALRADLVEDSRGDNRRSLLDLSENNPSRSRSAERRAGVSLPSRKPHRAAAAPTRPGHSDPKCQGASLNRREAPLSLWVGMPPLFI